jgi:hypothetical protein
MTGEKCCTSESPNIQLASGVGQQVIEAFAGRKALAEVAAAAKPDTLLRRCRARSLKKFDESTFPKVVGCPPVEEEIERLIRANGKGESELGI